MQGTISMGVPYVHCQIKLIKFARGVRSAINFTELFVSSVPHFGHIQVRTVGAHQ
jgi:hypothetical protein